MVVRNVFMESWIGLHTAGVTVFVLALMAVPFLVSLIANFGRPVPVALRKNRQRPQLSAHSRVSGAGRR